MSRSDREIAHPGAVCCQRPMTRIDVTSSDGVDARTLTLHVCSACGRHIWEGNGVVLDRAEVLDIVEHRVTEASASRSRPPR